MPAFYLRSDEDLAVAFRALQTADDVAALLDLPLGYLQALAYNRARKRYTTFRVPKRAGGHREITAPVKPLKGVQDRLLRVLHAVYHPRGVVHGFRKQRSAVTNANEHVGARWVLNVDLADFFGTITFPRVLGTLGGHPYNLGRPAATLIAALCCHEGKLPQGAPTSPILANMVAAPLDHALRSLAQQARCRYTRYADDLTFSTRKRLPPAIAARGEWDRPVIGAELRDTIERNGFSINEAKSRLRHYSERQEVTGLLANRRVNVPREYIRQVRAMLHAWERYGEEAAQTEFVSQHDAKRRPSAPHLFRNVVLGKLAYVGMVKGRGDPVYVRLVARARDRIDEVYGTDHFYSLAIPEDAIVVLEGCRQNAEGQDEPVQGTGFYLEGVGLVTCAHVLAPDLMAFPWHHPRRKYQTRALHQDDDWDVAVLATGAAPSFEFRRGSTVAVGVGTRVQVLGFPNWAEGRRVSVTDAVVQGEHPNLFGARRLSIDRAIFGGNSGGPVLNAAGEVIGIALRGMFQGGSGTENMVIPIDYAFDLLARAARREG